MSTRIMDYDFSGTNSEIIKQQKMILRKKVAILIVPQMPLRRRYKIIQTMRIF